jgi:hypothetical protein
VSRISVTSKHYPTRSSVKALFDYLSDFRSFGDILPPEYVEDFEAEAEQCSFTIKGITSLKVWFAEREPFTRIIYKGEPPPKPIQIGSDFTLEVTFTGEPGANGTCAVGISGNLNPFLKAMAQKPLTRLVEAMAERTAGLVPPSERS